MFTVMNTIDDWFCSPFLINYALLLLCFSWNPCPEHELFFSHPQILPPHPAHEEVFLVYGGKGNSKELQEILTTNFQLTSLWHSDSSVSRDFLFKACVGSSEPLSTLLPEQTEEATTGSKVFSPSRSTLFALSQGI